MNTNKSKRGGFTLIEMLAVLSIIIVIMGLAVGLVAVVNQKTAEAKAHKDIAIIEQALDKFKEKNGNYPAHMDQASFVLPPVIRPDIGGLNSQEFINAMGSEEQIYTDPWGQQYRYVKFSEHEYVVGCFGRDREAGVENLDDNGNGQGENNVDFEDLGYGDDITNRSQ